MGLLDEVIRAALGASSPPAPAAQAQPPRNTPNQDPLSQIAIALQELLAPKQGTSPSSSAPAASAGQQSGPGGLDVLIDQFKKSGLEEIMKSWIGTGQNRPISPPQLRQAIGVQRVNDLARQSGASQEDLLSQMARYLPAVIDKLTPNGQLPGRAELGPGYRKS
jgi:uncharacterized protein YidB (DUF937 family)